MQPGDLSIYIDFPCSRETFRQLLSTLVRLGDVASTSMNVPCGREAFRQISVLPREHL